MACAHRNNGPAPRRISTTDTAECGYEGSHEQRPHAVSDDLQTFNVLNSKPGEMQALCGILPIEHTRLRASNVGGFGEPVATSRSARRRIGGSRLRDWTLGNLGSLQSGELRGEVATCRGRWRTIQSRFFDAEQTPAHPLIPVPWVPHTSPQ